MIKLLYSDEVDVQEVLKMDGSFDHNSYSTNGMIEPKQEDMISIIENCDPSKYHDLYQYSVLDIYTMQVLPHELAMIMLEAGVSEYQIFYTTKIEAETLDYIIKNYFHNENISVSDVISRYNVNEDQLKIMIANNESSDLEDIAYSAANARKLDLCKSIIKLFNEYLHEYTYMSLGDLRQVIFRNTAHFVLEDSDCIELFGMNRPNMSGHDVREHGPCSDGWRRVLQWADNDDVSYAWNTFVARHTVANLDDTEAVESDLYWLAEAWSEENEHLFS